MEIISFWKHIFYLPYPQFPFFVLTFRTVAVATRVVADMLVTAMRTALLVTTHLCGTAIDEGAQDTCLI
jgi:hypothetical protein